MDENLTVFVNRRKKLTTRDELEKCSKEVSTDKHPMLRYLYDLFDNSQELIDRVLQLETHNQQLKNVLKKEIGTANGTSDNNQKKFDFSK